MELCRKKWGESDKPAHRVVERGIQMIKLHRSILDRELKQTGVYRGQHQILMMIADCPNASQKEIARGLHVSAPTVAVSLKKLEKGGYINRIVDQADNRYNQICITEKGKKVIEDSRRLFEEVEDSMFEGFSPGELKVMEELLERIHRNLLRRAGAGEGEGRSIT